MPSKIIFCVICGKESRHARSKFTTICTIERVRKVRQGYRRRRNEKLNVPLLNQQIHKSCYKSLVYDLEPVFTTRKTGRPILAKNNNQVLNLNPVLIDITNDQSTTTCDSYSFPITNSSNTLINTPILFRNGKHHVNTSTPINFILNEDKENVEPVKNKFYLNRSLFGSPHQDLSLIELDESHSIESPVVYSSISINHQSSTINSSSTQVEQNDDKDDEIMIEDDNTKNQQNRSKRIKPRVSKIYCNDI